MRGAGWVALVGLALAACGGRTQTAPLDWTLQSKVIDENLQVVQGMRVCAYGHPEIPCATTDKLGDANLALPSGKEFLVSYEKDGFYTKLREISASADELRGLNAIMVQSHRWYMQTPTPFGGQGALDLDNKGMASIEIHNGGAGVRFKLRRLDGKIVDFVGPMYWCVMNYFPHIVPCNHSATDDNDRGLVGFANLPPGDYEISIDASGSDKGDNVHCTQVGFQCPGKSQDCVTMHVMAGMLTYMDRILCNPGSG